jgi:hypothetical protein
VRQLYCRTQKIIGVAPRNIFPQYNCDYPWCPTVQQSDRARENYFRLAVIFYFISTSLTLLRPWSMLAKYTPLPKYGACAFQLTTPRSTASTATR